MEETSNINLDHEVEVKIQVGLNLDAPKSFFLFAGAGSGKTWTLIETLKSIREQNGARLSLSNQHVAVITYTNAACDEIKSRLYQDELFQVSTIHSFAWELVKPFVSDIKTWLRQDLTMKIADLEDQQSRGRQSKSSIDRAKKILSIQKRLVNLSETTAFTYNPNGDNLGKDSLNHSEVIGLASSFLMDKELMQAILVRRFPILLIDESQDTTEKLVNAFFTVQGIHKGQFSLGLIGDMMQRIYLEGKKDLGEEGTIPHDWLVLDKKLNHRCPQRVVRLINKIREDGDGKTQVSRSDKPEGFARLFIVAIPCSDKLRVESLVAERMAEITHDQQWFGEDKNVKTLTLEHHMAARRMGFSTLFEPLYKVEKLKTGLIDGSLPGIGLFTRLILPLTAAKSGNDKLSIARIITSSSPILDKQKLSLADNQMELIDEANKASNSLFDLWNDGNAPKLIDILKNISSSGLFRIPDSLAPIAKRTVEDLKVIEGTEEEPDEDRDLEIDAWDEALAAPFEEVKAYNKYVSDEGDFGTHQGVKGREFPRVLVVLDDDEARGFLFSYEKLFGVKTLSASDLKNQAEGNETGRDRTRRLFYVACSRAKESLAVVAYTVDLASFKSNAISNGWFEANEIEIIE